MDSQAQATPPSYISQTLSQTLSRSHADSYLIASIRSLRDNIVSAEHLVSAFTDEAFLRETNIDSEVMRRLVRLAQESALAVSITISRSAQGQRLRVSRATRDRLFSLHLTILVLVEAEEARIDYSFDGSTQSALATCRELGFQVPQAEYPSREVLLILKDDIPGIRISLAMGRDRKIAYKQHFGIYKMMEALEIVLRMHLRNIRAKAQDLVCSNLAIFKTIISRVCGFIHLQALEYHGQGWGWIDERHAVWNASDYTEREIDFDVLQLVYSKDYFDTELGKWSEGKCPAFIFGRIMDWTRAIKQLDSSNPSTVS